MDDIIGLFPLPPLQTEGMPGSPILTLSLLVYPPKHQVSGLAEVTQAVNPPVDQKFHVAGVYSTMTVMPRVTHYQIKLEGVLFNPDKVDLKATSGKNNQLFEAIVVLDETWQRGEVTYSYQGHPEAIHQHIHAIRTGTLAIDRAA